MLWIKYPTINIYDYKFYSFLISKWDIKLSKVFFFFLLS